MATRSTLPLALAALLFAAPSAAQPPTMEQLWPNVDGLSWSYDQHYELYGSDPQVVDNQLRVFFDGTTTAAGGIQTQYLHQELLSGPSAGALPVDAALVVAIPDPLLRAVWVARPDLRARIEQAVADAPCPVSQAPGGYAVLLGGEFAWLRTANEVAAWRCNSANTRSWQWLVSDLTIGNTFTLQLIPDITSDVFLHATIAALEPATVPAGTFAGCVRVDYVVDYGLSECTDESGNSGGTFRSETRGHVHFAPDVGPVDSFEQFIPYAEATGTCGAGQIGAPLATITLRLGSLPVPALPTSWGRLKVAYR
jgi:hypothetical protein